ncbi:pyruvate formate lyase family protein [Streptomyces sp. NPDC049915]|uniref:pyruvate formate lyase family protein n=1 Tax=Streptomyces sp. NPDC049915 TaxID=3155510 RepID=UPI0034268673
MRAYGYEPDPFVTKVFGSYRKTHNDGVFDGYTAAMRAARRVGVITGCPTSTAAAGSSAATAASPCTAPTG